MDTADQYLTSSGTLSTTTSSPAGPKTAPSSYGTSRTGDWPPTSTSSSLNSMDTGNCHRY